MHTYIHTYIHNLYTNHSTKKLLTLLEVPVKTAASMPLFHCSDVPPKFKALALLAVTFTDKISSESSIETVVLLVIVSLQSPNCCFHATFTTGSICESD